MWGDSSGFGGGGGFMAGATDSPASGDKQGKGRRSQNLMSVAIKQLLDCEEETLKVEGFEAHVVSIVGLVRGVETTTTKMSMYIDDQTGTIECVTYVGTDGDSGTDPSMLSEGAYGRVVGTLRSAKGQRYLVIFKCDPVTDLNEVTCHILEVLQTGIKLKKLRASEDAKPAGGAGLDNTFSNSMIQGGGFGGGGNVNGFTAKQNVVHRVISQSREESGMHKDEIIAAVRSQVSAKEVEAILEFLSNEGHVFSTIDDDHFKSTDPTVMS